MKIKLTLVSSIAAALAACAGGGQAEPTIPVAIPTATPMADVQLTADSGSITTSHTNPTAGGNFRQASVEVQTPYNFSYKEDRLVYQTASGNYYDLGSFTGPIIPSYSSPSYNMLTKHTGQPLSEGGKFFVCCGRASQTSYVPATKQDYLKFGAWVGANGQSDLFFGGFPVGTVKGASGDNNTAKGKTTYEVLALRVRDGNVVSSSYNPSKNGSTPVLSLLTANFNTNKLGGTIVGNQDYGADVVMKDVDIDGISFRGTAESDGKTGQVEGGFFGKFYSSYEQEVSIGGKVTFNADRSLDTVFGGVPHKTERDSTDTTLTPLAK